MGDWDRPYDRETAVFPLPDQRHGKYWSPVGRVDNVYGDRNLVCACPPMEDYMDAAEKRGRGHERDGRYSPEIPLDALHRELGATMVPFAGYAMPVSYPLGVMKEHLHTRERAGLFDVSHMGQVRLYGDQAAVALEGLTTGNIIGLKAGRQRYTLFTNEAGGILDDFMVCNAGDYLQLVVNAACKEADLAHLRANLDDQVWVEPLEDRALLALQGPEAAAVLAEIAPETTEMVFMDARVVAVDGIECFVTRSGYTGEDGFEISVPAASAETLARRLLAFDAVEPIGLGARDSLRLEAGLCLYGHDMDTETTPVEASLDWAISKLRRPGGSREGGYPGAEVIARQLEHGVERRRVGLRPEGRAPVREGAPLQGGRRPGDRSGHQWRLWPQRRRAGGHGLCGYGAGGTGHRGHRRGPGPGAAAHRQRDPLHPALLPTVSWDVATDGHGVTGYKGRRKRGGRRVMDRRWL
ncbi:MAG: glycine cleavage system aminomethyltransferase GcvT [Arhodomonas sp.]|nr:glycine cleavage system aminomethyltransferase GcvT [Arhodomonas sp.]